MFIRYFFGRFRCFFSGLTSFLKTGQWISHVYMQAVIPRIIISNNKGFRVSSSYEHTADETVHPNGGLVYGKCIYCGKESKGFCHDFIKYTEGEEQLGIIEQDENGDYIFVEKETKDGNGSN